MPPSTNFNSLIELHLVLQPTVLAGLGLKTEELSKAFTRLRFNFFVQVFNFGVVSAFVFGFTKLVLSLGWLSENLAEGMIICACLPITVNMVCVLTVSAGGDEASAIFNAAFGNVSISMNI